MIGTFASCMYVLAIAIFTTLTVFVLGALCLLAWLADADRIPEEGRL